MNKMMLIEHLAIVFLVITIAYLVVLFSALFAQLLDVDHTCAACSLSERVDLLLKCGRSSDINTFPQECYALHRGVFHSVKLLYLEIFLVLVMIGFVSGHAIHLFADDYDVLKLKWIVEHLRSFI